MVFQGIHEISSFHFSNLLIKQFHFVPWTKSFHLLVGLCPSVLLLCPMGRCHRQDSFQPVRMTCLDLVVKNAFYKQVLHQSGCAESRSSDVRYFECASLFICFPPFIVLREAYLLTKAGEYVFKWTNCPSPRTNVHGVAESLSFLLFPCLKEEADFQKTDQSYYQR